MSTSSNPSAELPSQETLSAYTFVNEYTARTLPLKLALVACSLVFLHVAAMTIYWESSLGRLGDHANRLHYYQVSMFDLDTESGLGTWYSSMALLFIGRLLWHHAKLTRRRKEIWCAWWFVLAVGFHWLSLDEMIASHEILNQLKSDAAQQTGAVRERWTHEGFIVVLFVGAAFLPFLWRIGRRLATFSILGGLVYVGGCLGIEQATDRYEDWGMLQSTEYQMWVALEEGMEMIGPLIFLYGLMHYLAKDKARAPMTPTSPK